jgi:hypothetical protein
MHSDLGIDSGIGSEISLKLYKHFFDPLSNCLAGSRSRRFGEMQKGPSQSASNRARLHDNPPGFVVPDRSGVRVVDGAT